jgi:hypothetical protein
VTVYVVAVDDNHLPKVKMTQQHGPFVRLVEVGSHSPQERHVDVLFEFDKKSEDNLNEINPALKTAARG